MSDREARAEKIRADAAAHPVVRFAVSSLIPGEDPAKSAFAARPTTTSSIEEKLRALGPTDDLVAAVLGLVDLAYILRSKQSSPEAADAILAALLPLQALVDDALSTLPPDDEALAAIRAARFETVRGTAKKVERRPPAANEVAGGPLARLALSKPIKKDPP